MQKKSIGSTSLFFALFCFFTPNFFSASAINTDQETIIEDILQTISTDCSWTLKGKKKQLEQKGELIESIHPLDYLTFVIEHDQCVVYFSKKWNSEKFAWRKYRKKTARRLAASKKQDGFDAKWNQFKGIFSADPEVIQKLEVYADKNQWEKMIIYLRNHLRKQIHRH